MKVKLNRGPAKGQYMEIKNASDVVRFSVPNKVSYWAPQEDDLCMPTCRIGEYRRSNRKLKNGATVYEWMGWINEV